MTIEVDGRTTLNYILMQLNCLFGYISRGNIVGIKSPCMHKT